MSKPSKDATKVLGLDVSTKTIGFALFEYTNKKLVELTHFTPIIKPIPETKIEELFKKADSFREMLLGYTDMGIIRVVIEEPLMNSNNIYTVSTLMRYNAMISKNIYDIFGIVPDYISTYDARRYGLPQLMGDNPKGKPVLFGGFPKDVDKKAVVWREISDMYPEIKWLYNKKGIIMKECYDMSDAATAALGFMQKEGIW